MLLQELAASNTFSIAKHEQNSLQRGTYYRLFLHRSNMRRDSGAETLSEFRNCGRLIFGVQLLLQTQPMSCAPATERYTGLRDAWRRLPEREGARVGNPPFPRPSVLLYR